MSKNDKKKARFKDEIKLICIQAAAAFNIKLLTEPQESAFTVTAYSRHDAYLGTVTAWFYPQRKKRNREIDKLTEFFLDIQATPARPKTPYCEGAPRITDKGGWPII